MDYRYHLSQALLLFERDEAAALAELARAEAAAAAVDPEGPRVAEVLNYTAQLHRRAGRPAEARDALERVCAIWERFPALAEGLADFYLELMDLCATLGDADAARSWQAKARAAAAGRPRRPQR
jgi:hypothetical protein